MSAPTKQTYICDECGNGCEEVIEAANANGDSCYVCQDCVDASYFYCEECGTYNHDLLRTEARDQHNDLLYVCSSCIESYFTSCDDCGEFVHSGSVFCVENTGEYICRTCYEDGEYFTCNSCGAIFSNDAYYDDDLCNRCYNEEHDTDIIHQYSYTPDLAFYTSPGDTSDTHLYMGIELEYENDASSDRDAHAQIWDDSQPERFYLKEDGSLDCGLEAVSHPHTLRAWNDQRTALDTLFKEIRSNTSTYTADNTGLHIHLSKKGMSDIHKVRLFAFMSKNSEEYVAIARREANHWTKKKDITKGGLLKEVLKPDDRYQTVNWYPTHTVEFRLFKSTLDINELFTCLQFCHAVYQFTKNAVSIATICKGNSWEIFKDFVASRKNIYQDLHKELN